MCRGGESEGMRKSVLPWLACAVIALIAIPAFASGAAPRGAPTQSTGPAPAPTVTFKTTSASADQHIIVGDGFFQDAAGDQGDNSVSINAGEKVTFTQGEDVYQGHNAVFSGPQPSSCVQLTGDTIDDNTTAPL